MSHVTKLDLAVYDRPRDWQALERTCAILGLEKRQQTHYRKWGASGECICALGVPGNLTAYEVGLVADSKGVMTFQFDDWQEGHGLIDKIGWRGEKLTQEFARQRALLALQEEGFDVASVTVLADGTIDVEARPGVQYQFASLF